MADEIDSNQTAVDENVKTVTDTGEVNNNDVSSENSKENTEDKVESAADSNQSETNTEDDDENKKNRNDKTSNNSASKLFVGRLPSGTVESSLKELFSKYGEVTHCDIVGKYGFIHMKNKDEADEAMKNLNNFKFNGSEITVQLSTSTSKNRKRQNRKRNFVSKNMNNNNHNNNPQKTNYNNHQNNRFNQNQNNIKNRYNRNGQDDSNRNRNRNIRYNRPSMNDNRSMQVSMPPMNQNYGYNSQQSPMMNSYYQKLPVSPYNSEMYNNNPLHAREMYYDVPPNNFPRSNNYSDMNMSIYPLNNNIQQGQNYPYNRGSGMNKQLYYPAQQPPMYQQQQPQIPNNYNGTMGTYQPPDNYWSATNNFGY
ncbi:hypothetical protein NH340_JMT02657 [Sarcoptes scabiei]|nr:hypothetical protein NH340_JMT02657 [Sarcoptes scabiei]